MRYLWNGGSLPHSTMIIRLAKEGAMYLSLSKSIAFAPAQYFPRRRKPHVYLTWIRWPIRWLVEYSSDVSSFRILRDHDLTRQMIEISAPGDADVADWLHEKCGSRQFHFACWWGGLNHSRHLPLLRHVLQVHTRSTTLELYPFHRTVCNDASSEYIKASWLGLRWPWSSPVPKSDD